MQTSSSPLALRPREAAAMLSVSQRTLWQWTQDGKVPCKRVGGVVLYAVADLERWLAGEKAAGGDV